MKRNHLFMSLALSLFLLGSFTTANAQQTKKAAAFHGAKAVKSDYKAIYQLDTDNDKVITATLRNMANALKDPRLGGKLQLELVAHGGGITVFLKKNKFGPLLKKLADQGVILAACENTLRSKNISPSELFPFVSYVPSGNGELIIRQQQGWAIIHP